MTAFGAICMFGGVVAWLLAESLEWLGFTLLLIGLAAMLAGLWA